MVSVSRRHDGDVLTLAVSGEVDLATGPVVEEAITEAVASSGVSVVEVDLSGVGFLDSSCIAVLLKGRRGADEHGVAYRVTGAQGIALEVLQISGVWEHLSGNIGSTSEPTMS